MLRRLAVTGSSLAERDTEYVRRAPHDDAGAVQLRCGDREPKKLWDALGGLDFDQSTNSRAIANQAVDRLQLLANPEFASTENIPSNRSASLDIHLSSSSSIPYLIVGLNHNRLQLISLLGSSKVFRRLRGE